MGSALSETPCRAMRVVLKKHSKNGTKSGDKMIFWIGRGNDLKTKYIPLIVGLNETLPFHGKSVNISKINRNGNDIFVVNFKISN